MNPFIAITTAAAIAAVLAASYDTHFGFDIESQTDRRKYYYDCHHCCYPLDHAKQMAVWMMAYYREVIGQADKASTMITVTS